MAPSGARSRAAAAAAEAAARSHPRALVCDYAAAAVRRGQHATWADARGACAGEVAAWAFAASAWLGRGTGAAMAGRQLRRRYGCGTIKPGAAHGDAHNAQNAPRQAARGKDISITSQKNTTPKSAPCLHASVSQLEAEESDCSSFTTADIVWAIRCCSRLWKRTLWRQSRLPRRRPAAHQTIAR